MIRSIPPITSTGSSRPTRSAKRGPSPVIRIGMGERKVTLRKGREKFKPIHTWTFASKPTFARYHRTQTDQYVLVEKIREPAVRILEDIGEVVVVAYLPGVEQKDIHIEFHGDILDLSTQASDKFGLEKYAKEILLPFMADPEATESSLKNDILEIKLQQERSRR